MNQHSHSAIEMGQGFIVLRSTGKHDSNTGEIDLVSMP
jgi:hypothetical protein